MFCPHCGSEAKEDANFCKMCGKSLRQETASKQSQKPDMGSKPPLGSPPKPNSKKKFLGLAILAVMIFAVGSCIFGTGGPSTPSATSGLAKDALVQYFSHELGFKFGGEGKGKGDTSVYGELGKADSSQYVTLEVIYKGNAVKATVMGVWLNGDNSVGNRDLVYITKLIGKILPDIKNPDEVVKQGVSEALGKNRAVINASGKILEFSYVKDAGGVEGENAIIFGYDTTAKPEDLPVGGKIDVTFSVEPKITAGHVQITGTTNLPDKTDLMISLSNASGYLAQSKARVSGGKFASQSFSKGGGPLDKGTYNVTISTPYVIVQDEAVQKALGKHGELFSGQYVHSEASGNIVTYKTAIEMK